ncbi:MAG: multicopper oxidase domain-containing protein [Myxococcales bacterium]|nr:multicopper oxidase domain-containing protein [Myxococcales bacterium]
MPRAKDLDPSPGVFELELEAGVGKARYVAAGTTPVWTYNGTSPGPLIELAVGDRLKAHFSNALPEETTVHWHGLRIPAAMDGTMAMQNPTQPGGTFEYEFVVKDAGLFWFHPHVRSDEQVEKGLYAPIVVRGPNEPSADREVVWMLDDVALEADGSRPEYLDDESKMLGRHGDTLLVNGVVSPTVEVQAGEPPAHAPGQRCQRALLQSGHVRADLPRDRKRRRPRAKTLRHGPRVDRPGRALRRHARRLGRARRESELTNEPTRARTRHG